jgi:hypothetical protein
MKSTFLDRCSKNAQNLMKIPPAGAKLFGAGRRTHMTKTVVAYRNFVNAHNDWVSSYGDEIVTAAETWGLDDCRLCAAADLCGCGCICMACYGATFALHLNTTVHEVTGSGTPQFTYMFVLYPRTAPPPPTYSSARLHIHTDICTGNWDTDTALNLLAPELFF